MNGALTFAAQVRRKQCDRHIQRYDDARLHISNDLVDPMFIAGAHQPLPQFE